MRKNDYLYALIINKLTLMKATFESNVEDEDSRDEKWPVRPYYKSELAAAYAPNISPVSALNRLAQWLKHNSLLHTALLQTGYKTRQHVFTSMQVELIFKYIGRP